MFTCAKTTLESAGESVKCDNNTKSRKLVRRWQGVKEFCLLAQKKKGRKDKVGGNLNFAANKNNVRLKKYFTHNFIKYYAYKNVLKRYIISCPGRVPICHMDFRS